MVPAWLIEILAVKFVEAGISMAQSQIRKLPAVESLKKYLDYVKSQLETIPYKIPCPTRHAALSVETFFLWPQLAASRKREENRGAAKKEALPERIPAEDLLFSPPAGKNLFAVEGPAGVGKTTLARSLVYWTAKETRKLSSDHALEAKLARPFLPVYLDAWDLAQIAEDRVPNNVRWIQIPSDWGLLVVVDGLDELEPSLKNRALERLKGPWLQEADKNLVFLFGRPGSARSLSWEPREERILALELRPWTLEEVNGYLERWRDEGSIQKEDARQMLEYVKKNFGAPVVPLMVYLLVCDFLETREIGSLPRNRLELYERYLIRTVLHESEGTTPVHPKDPHPLSEDEVFALGCLELAIREDAQLEARIHRAHANCNDRPLHRLRRRWEACSQGSRVPWDMLLPRWKGRGLCWLGHKSFHDFLAAIALARRYRGRPRDFWREWIRPRVFEPYWTQALAFATALLPDPDRRRILSGLLALADCDPVSRETKRHHAVIAEIIAESTRAEEELLNAWLSQKPAPEHIARIHRVAPAQSLPVLENLAWHQDPWVCLEAAEALAQLGHHEKALPALEKLAQHQNPWVRLQAARALTQPGEKALPILENFVWHQESRVRLQAARALAQLGHHEKALPILENLAQDPDPGVRLQAARALAQLGHHEKALPILENLARHQDPWICLEAAEALAQLGHHEKALPILENLAQDPDPGVRMQAARALTQLGHPPLGCEELPETPL